MKQKVYIISGTLGSGKSTVSKLLESELGNSVRIEADDFLNETEGDKSLSWGKRLEIMWSKVIKRARKSIGDAKNIIIDGVVEDELPQLISAFGDCSIYYCILIADENTLKQRVAKRGDRHSIERSLDVLSQFQADPEKAKYLLDTSGQTPEEVLAKVGSLKPLTFDNSVGTMYP